MYHCAEEEVVVVGGRSIVEEGGMIGVASVFEDKILRGGVLFFTVYATAGSVSKCKTKGRVAI